MEEKKLRIYWKEFDENGNEINRGVDEREYVSMGHAYNRARKLYGEYKRFRYRVSWRDPWVTYPCKVKCGTCGKTFTTEQDMYEHPITASVSLFRRGVEEGEFGSYRRMRVIPADCGKICPDCADKIEAFILGLKKGE